MAKKNGSARGDREKSAVDLAINAFRAAHVEWDRSIPPVGVSIAAGNADGVLCTWHYWLPSGYNGINTAEDAARFGFAKPDWSTLSQPILPPTDAEWRTSYDTCATARVVLANAADQLDAAIQGTDDSARHLRAGATRLAGMLRQVPPVWPTKVEIDLAFEINNSRIVEYRQAINEARRRREAAEAAATEERRKQKAERADDALIAWHAAQKNGAPAEATTSNDPDENNYSPSSEGSVTAIVRALDKLRPKDSDPRPTKERIKEVADVGGGAGDRAIEVAERKSLISPDLLVTAKGREFLKNRS